MHQKTLNDLPTELIQRIFCYIHPSSALKCFRLSKRIRSCLIHTDFVAMNLDQFIRNDLYTMAIVSSPDEFAKLWFRWPECYQSAYAMKYLKYMSLMVWNFKALSGCIPASIGLLSHLNTLRLEDNSLSGNIPPQIGYLTSLTTLNLKGNQFTGTIPTEVGSLRNLYSLNLSGNKLCGHIPSELGSLHQLETLFLNSNALTGPIPSSFGNLKILEILNLEENRLSGMLPPELGNCTKLIVLYLAGNKLEGDIPIEFGNLDRLLEFCARPGNQSLGNVVSSEIQVKNPRLYNFIQAGLRDEPDTGETEEDNENVNWE
ncbi:hypothetical protein HDU99_002520 [Rhizoclosmatium hyalinum]|nr:hypothetical protein HDU99_002520 [Rhizoclosmatium hyalinum]